MTRTILDTSVLIHDEGRGIGGRLAISVASIAELRFGVLVADDSVRAVRLERLTRVQRMFDALPMDEAVAAGYAELAAATVRAGRQPRRRGLDLVIAATALAHSARLATANIDDLIHLEGLVELIRWPVDPPD